MRVDLDRYTANKEFVQRWYRAQEAKAQYDSSTLISTISLSTMVPAIVCAYWVGEITGWREETVSLIQTLIKFYGYTEVLNKPPGAP